MWLVIGGVVVFAVVCCVFLYCLCTVASRADKKAGYEDLPDWRNE